VKGQVVIPRWLRKEFEIEAGTRAYVYRDGDAIVLKPVTPKQIKNLRGSLKGAGILKALMDDRKREREL
jgi:AbrB family looped-hinge helix DNA binding protein